MKLQLKRPASLALAMSLCAALAGCGSTASVSESDASPTPTAGPETSSEDTYAYLASFDYSSVFDDNGYLKDVTALEYVTLPEGFEQLTLSAEGAAVSAEEITDYINNNVLANYTTTEQLTTRAAEMGDSVNIDYVGSIDGVEFEGGNSGGSGYDLTLGSGTFIDDFEDQIAGHTPGETFDVVVTFPDNYSNEELSGKEALFKTTLNYINAVYLPELTDDWVVDNLGEEMGFASVSDLNNFVNDTILFDQQANEVYALLSQNAEIADTLPEDAVSFYRDLYLYRFYQMASVYGMTLDQLLSMYGYESADDFISVYQSTFEDNVRQQLIMQAAAEALDVKCDDAALAENFQHYFGSVDNSAHVSAYGTNFVKMTLMQDLTMQKLIDNAVYE